VGVGKLVGVEEGVGVGDGVSVGDGVEVSAGATAAKRTVAEEPVPARLRKGAKRETELPGRPETRWTVSGRSRDSARAAEQRRGEATARATSAAARAERISTEVRDAVASGRLGRRRMGWKCTADADLHQAWATTLCIDIIYQLSSK
jgi:hypothetical protein